MCSWHSLGGFMRDFDISLRDARILTTAVIACVALARTGSGWFTTLWTIAAAGLTLGAVALLMSALFQIRESLLRREILDELTRSMQQEYASEHENSVTLKVDK